ncbi:cell wall-binding repeat-containing protein [Herbiconiux daphne]|uniref:Cell wall-binding repeat-containing protein n=1 Tax=Herbiconiux daphne TaxID=2970914 RepID=A0ABT2H7G7_9MICO|nr:cell wall-binding repeat-containing protein [Herbiconiux daphne]MCS5735910.1 cell wall-binding repeat-containing protein [Herbiconiux daphne]
MRPSPLVRSPRLRGRILAAVAASAVAGAVILAPSAAQAASTAVDDDYTLAADAVFTVPAGLGVLANDIGLDVSALVQVKAAPAHGTVGSIGAGGVFTYTPQAGFVGADVFTYCIALPVIGCVSADASVHLHLAGTVERIGGADRYAVSAGVSAAKFEPGVGTAYIASGEVFPDALSASAAAGAIGGPVLLVTKGAIPDVVGVELTRLKPKTIVVLGGSNTIDATVETALHSYAPTVTRVGGADRYAVSAGISAMSFAPERAVAYVASGEVFPDALSGSAAAGLKGGPVLLVTKNSIPAAVATELTRLDPDRIVVLGGTNTVSDAVQTALGMSAPTTRVAGADRFVVSSNVSADAFLAGDTHTVYVASGEVFPDALSGSAAAIKNHAPVLLVTKNAIPASVATELDRLHVTRIVVLGGPNTVSEATVTALQAHLAH